MLFIRLQNTVKIGKFIMIKTLFIGCGGSFKKTYKVHNNIVNSLKIYLTMKWFACVLFGLLMGNAHLLLEPHPDIDLSIVSDLSFFNLRQIIYW